MNRLVLLLIGLVSVVSAGWVAVRAYPELIPALALPAIPELDALTTGAVAAGAVLVIVGAVAWIVTRGGGRTRQLLRVTSENGAVELETAVAADLLSHALAQKPDILSLRFSTYRVRRARALRISVQVRSGCDLPRLRGDVSDAVAHLDTALEQRIPVLLHVTSGVRAGFAREQRVA